MQTMRWISEVELDELIRNGCLNPDEIVEHWHALTSDYMDEETMLLEVRTFLNALNWCTYTVKIRLKGDGSHRFEYLIQQQDAPRVQPY